MSQSELIAPGRMDSLLAGDPPESVREAVVQGLVRELRASAPAAPARLRERVLVERVPAPPRVNRRTLSTVLIAAALAAAVSAAIAFRPDVNASESGINSSGAPATAEEKAAKNLSGSSSDSGNGALSGQPIPEPLSGASADALGGHRTSDFSGAFELGRARDVKMTMELRLRNADELSEAAKKAMRTTAKLGGVVAASKIDTSGAKGTATLQLQIPVGKLDQAVAELSQLGTITEQNVTAVDLQGAVDETVKRIRHLRAAIAADKLRLESGTLTAAQKLDVQLRLVRERQQLDQIRRERAAYLAEAATAEVTLGLHTARGAAVGATHGAFRRTLESGLTGLSKVAAVTLLALIVAAPLLLLGTLLWLVGRSRRRRIEAEILNRPRPATPSTPPPA